MIAETAEKSTVFKPRRAAPERSSRAGAAQGCDPNDARRELCEINDAIAALFEAEAPETTHATGQEEGKRMKMELSLRRRIADGFMMGLLILMFAGIIAYHGIHEFILTE